MLNSQQVTYLVAPCQNTHATTDNKVNTYFWIQIWIQITPKI